MALTEAEARELIAEVESRYREDHERIQERRKHFHNDPEVDPVLPKPYTLRYPFQADAPRQLHNALKARVSENQFTIQGRGMGNPSSKTSAARAAQYLNLGLKQQEKRLGYSIQGALATGQIRDKFGVLHWLKADDLLPPVNEERVDRDRLEDVARAGFPWWIEVLDPVGFMPVPDRSIRPGYGLVVVRREVGLLSYQRVRQQREKTVRALSEIPGAPPVQEERDAPDEESPSRSGWSGTTIPLYQVWDREQWVEVIGETGRQEIVAGGKHDYGMPPFAVAAAIETHDNDPVRRYEPALTGIYRLKPIFDYWMALFFATAEYGMLPYWYMESTGDGMPMADQSGRIVLLDRQSIAATSVPEGFTLKKLEFDISPSYIQGGAMLREEFKAAAPATGRAEFDRNSQPWSIRLQQAQENVEPGILIDNQLSAFDTMVANMAHIHAKPSAKEGGFGEPLALFVTQDKGELKAGDMLSVEPSDFENVSFSTAISNVSAAERITAVQAGMEELNNPLVPLSPRKFLIDYKNDPDPDDTISEYEGWKTWEEFVKPGVQRQMLIETYGHIVRFGPDGHLVGPDGQPVAPVQALQAAGFEVGPEGGGGSPLQQGAQVQTTPGDLSPLQTPGTTPLQGIRG